MANPIDASSILDATSINNLEELIEVNDAIKTLETRKQALVNYIKQLMFTWKIDSLKINGRIFSLVKSQQRTVIKDTKNEFIAGLINMDKKHLVVTSINPDLNSIFAEVDAGTLNRDFVDKYVKITPITTLRCT